MDLSKLLPFARWKSCNEVVKFLLNAGVNIEARDIYGWTPLHMFISRGWMSVVQFDNKMRL